MKGISFQLTSDFYFFIFFETAPNCCFSSSSSGFLGTFPRSTPASFARWGGGTPAGADHYSLSPHPSWGRCIRTWGVSPTLIYPAGSPLTPNGPLGVKCSRGAAPRSGTRCGWEPSTDFAPTPSSSLSTSGRPAAASVLKTGCNSCAVRRTTRSATRCAVRGAERGSLAPRDPGARPPRRSPAPLGAPLPAPQSPETQLPVDGRILDFHETVFGEGPLAPPGT